MPTGLPRALVQCGASLKPCTSAHEGPAGRSEARCRREATGEAFPTIPQGVVAFGLGPFQKEGRIRSAAVRIPGPDNSGRSGADTSASTWAALVPCGIRALRFAAVETSFDGSPPQGVAVTWLRGTPERAPKRPTVLDCSHEGSNRRGAASLRTRLPWLRSLPLPVAITLKSMRPKALRLGVRPPRGGQTREGRAFRHPSPNGGECPRWRHVPCRARHRAPTHEEWRGLSGKLTRSRPGPPINPPARGGSAAAGCQRLAHGEKGGCRAGTP